MAPDWDTTCFLLHAGKVQAGSCFKLYISNVQCGRSVLSGASMSKHKRPGRLCDGILGGNSFPFFGSVVCGAHFCMRAGWSSPSLCSHQAGPFRHTVMQAASQSSHFPSRSCSDGWCRAGARMSAVLSATSPGGICGVVFSADALSLLSVFKANLFSSFLCEFPACPWLCLCWWVGSAFPSVLICLAQPSGDKSVGGGFETHVPLS